MLKNWAIEQCPTGSLFVLPQPNQRPLSSSTVALGSEYLLSAAETLHLAVAKACIQLEGSPNRHCITVTHTQRMKLQIALQSKRSILNTCSTWLKVHSMQKNISTPQSFTVNPSTFSCDWCSQHITQISLLLSVWESEREPGRKLVHCLEDNDTPGGGGGGGGGGGTSTYFTVISIHNQSQSLTLEDP